MNKFEAFVVTEVVRNHELQNGPLTDQHVLAQARVENTPEKRVITRATLLAESLGYLQAIRDWITIRLLAFSSLAIIAVIAGWGLGRSVLVSTNEPLSIAWIFMILLGLHGISFVIWLIFTLGSGNGGGIGGKLFELITSLRRKKFGISVFFAATTVAARHGLMKPAMSVITHCFWILLLLLAMLTLYTQFLFNEYSFRWATTVLSNAEITRMSEIIGWLPAKFGISVPTIEQLLSNDDFTNNAIVSKWILAVLFCYGILPRLLAALICFGWLMLAKRNLKLDLTQPGISHLLNRLTPVSTSATVVDADIHKANSLRAGKPLATGSGELVFSLEYELEPDWNHLLWLNSAGVIASLAERSTLIKQIQSKPPARILVRINSKLSPDRGSLRFLQSLQQQCGSLGAWLVDHGAYYEHWSEALAEIDVLLFSIDEEAVRWAQGNSGSSNDIGTQ
ncbi:Protein of unknown function (DUF2868) [Idiomarina sp. A28L]|uniref:DUF2868 domain-containing protein n=1 Tax=Idiomarina sp. A28L TaxID=1036674 RepID=UPI00021389BD|nr:DUF2868 domain-containing protein [Idiomarina sp. A28L]EGN74995.1 Protein of unknown function (DUF2868) [Idiomarina sp. A28L]